MVCNHPSIFEHFWYCGPTLVPLRFSFLFIFLCVGLTHVWCAGVVDFEMSIAMPTNSQLARAPDLISIPLVASAVVPAYHVRALSERLVYITEIWWF